MSKAAMAEMLAGLRPALEGDEPLHTAAALAQKAAESHDEGEASYSREDVIRAADIVSEIYGDDAIAQAERTTPPGKQLFAKLVLRELQRRAGK